VSRKKNGKESERGKEMKKVIIAGAAGRMGQRVAAMVHAHSGLVCSAAFEASGSSAIGKDAGEVAGLGFLGVPIAEGLEGIAVGDEIIVITWLHHANRNTLQVHPRRDTTRPLTGVFATRSPDRPNPLGLHRVTVLNIDGNRLQVGPLEAIDGTPVVDIKSALRPTTDSE